MAWQEAFCGGPSNLLLGLEDRMIEVQITLVASPRNHLCRTTIWLSCPKPSASAESRIMLPISPTSRARRR
jgi:hypothetical protein